VVSFYVTHNGLQRGLLQDIDRDNPAEDRLKKAADERQSHDNVNQL
jgi:hypothetical protein